MSSDQRRELKKSRTIATGLLVGMTGLFLLASWLLPTYPGLAYVRAFAEAAMIGALADWFAVTALFRHPLGLPIPHTAVVPRNKDRIGESLGRFVEQNFLPPEVIRSRLAAVDFAGLLAGWLADPANAARVSAQLTAMLPDLLRGLDDEQIGRFVRDELSARLEDVDIAPLAGKVLDALMAGNRHQQMLEEALRQSTAFIAEKEPFIRQKIRDNTGWLWQKLSVDERAFNAIMDAIEAVVRNVEEDADHELRQRFDCIVRDFARDLRESPKYHEPAEAIKRDLIRNPAFQAYLAGMWDGERERLLADIAKPDSETRCHLQAAVLHAGETLIGNPALHDKLNAWLRQAIAELLEARRHEVARLIPDTVRTWDAETMAQRLELQVGRDLQFIRINGTLVGGLVGLAIFTASRLAA